MSQALTFNGKTLHPVSHNNEMWFTAADLSRALGYEKPDAATQVYERNKDEFSPNMVSEILGKCKVGFDPQSEGLGEFRGLRGTTRIFSLRGCHLIAMFAKTVIAKQFRVWVLDLIEGKPEVPNALHERPIPELFSEGEMTVHSFNGVQVKEQGDYFWVSQLCQYHYKNPRDFLVQKRFSETVRHFPAAKVGAKGTWVHRGVLISLAHWLSDECGNWAYELISDEKPKTITLVEYMKTVEQTLRLFGLSEAEVGARMFLVA